MANIENKLILFLADPQFTKEELNKLHKSLSSGNVDIFFKKVRKITAIIADDSRNYNNSHIDNNLTDFERKILDEVTLLLRKEAGMTVKSAINSLVNILNTIPPSPKKSFKEQILLLVKNKGGSEVINAAYKIRNLESHNNSNSHWPLRDNE